MFSKDKRGRGTSRYQRRKSSVKLPNKVIIIRISKRVKRNLGKVSKLFLDFKEFTDIHRTLSENKCNA